MTLTLLAIALAALASWFISVRILRAVGLMDVREERMIACGSSQLEESAWTRMSKGEQRDVVERVIE